METVTLKIGKSSKVYEIKYTWRSVRDLCSRLSKPSETCTIVRLIDYMRQMDPEAITQALFIGLAHGEDRKKLTGEDVENMIDDYLQGGGRLSDIMSGILEALQQSGAIPTPKRKDGEPDPTPTT